MSTGYMRWGHWAAVSTIDADPHQLLGNDGSAEAEVSDPETAAKYTPGVLDMPWRDDHGSDAEFATSLPSIESLSCDARPVGGKGTRAV